MDSETQQTEQMECREFTSRVAMIYHPTRASGNTQHNFARWYVPARLILCNQNLIDLQEKKIISWS